MAVFTTQPDLGVQQRIQASGKLFGLAGRKWYLKGLVYGPFAPNSEGLPLPERPQLLRDLAQMRDLGANCIRLYHPPPPSLLDDLLEHGLRVMVDVPWEKHRCFFEDWASQQDAINRVRQTARQIGKHPAVFAISVANEIPHDVVRFYRARKVERFVDDLLDCAKEEAPDCLFTYSNYPSTEFLNPTRVDFYCANIYLHDPIALNNYLDRLQHIADTKPLVLGEHGMDSMRHGAAAQAQTLAEQVQCLFRRGAAGSFVFSFTDDWFTGGHQITDWAFGITRADRSEKPAAGALAAAWKDGPALHPHPAPKASVVVCAYNGADTLEECLRSLRNLDYPNYEVIVVDDGSTDRTPQIAARFPEFRLIRQENRGLSAARNAGALAATGEIVAYTDCDCMADQTWLSYLVRSMIDQQVDAIGGPNLTPPSDNWTARCVAVSPGNPCHVMINDREAEHVPGCNMAFTRDALLRLGGFDEQFRVAGDDVDICWRFIDAGLKIGYAPAALVWHHRRSTVGAYLRQQKGYGRSEAMVQFKHPHRFNALGCFRWCGVIYGDGGLTRADGRAAVYHGRFGSGAFQIIYRQSNFSVWSYFTMLEWHALAALVATLSVAYWPLLGVSLLMWCATFAAGIRASLRAPLESGAPRWCRPLLCLLHIAQPMVRSLHRHKYRIAERVGRKSRNAALATNFKKLSASEFDLYWQSDDGRGREQLLHALIDQANAERWRGDYFAEWQPHDLELIGDLWHDVQISTATEELGGPKRFTRARCALRLTWFSLAIGTASVLWLFAAALSGKQWTAAPAAAVAVSVWTALVLSRRRMMRAVSGLLWRAGFAAGLAPFAVHQSAQRPEASAAKTDGDPQPNMCTD
jgi:glycosyltransferase involved in cell wall biosynthesis